MHAARGLRALTRGALGTLYEEMAASAVAFEHVGSVRSALEMAGGAGFVLLELGSLERGEEMLRRTIRRSREVGLEHLCAVARHNLGRRVGESGRFEEGLTLEREALASFAAHGNRRMVGLTHAHIAWILLAAGRLDEARAAADEALTHLHDHTASKIVALATRAQIHLRRGDVAQAVTDAEAAERGLQSLGRIQEGESLIRLTWAEALLAAGRAEEAATAVAAAVRSLDERAALIEQAPLRASFRGLPENRRIAEIAGERRTGPR
jgi:tetratricopeptide (TPR) repeat protein